MKQEIKERIEQINRGIVPNGFKKSAYGLVPADWKEIVFFELFNEKSEYTDDFSQFPLYTLSIGDGIISKPERYDREHLVKKEKAYKVLPQNYFAYNPMNARFGAIARNKCDYSVAVSGYYDIFNVKYISDLLFMDSFLVSDKMINYYNRMATGSLIEKQRVHFSQFLQFKLPLPNLSEREKIAEILSTQDKVIELKEKLIEQKYLQKKYVIQKLILNESSTNEMIKLGCWINEIDVRSTCNNMYPVLTSSRKGICLQEDYFNKSVSSLDNTGYKVLSKNDFVYRTISDDGVFVFNKLDLIEKGLISPAYYSFRCNNNCDSDYLYYLLNSGYLKKDISILMQGGTRLSLNFGKLCSVLIPNVSLGKQKRISEIIKTLDKEIKLLEQELEQEKQKKKALMQLLLTGIVRIK